MPVARNVTPQGSFDSGAAYGDYLGGGLGGEWQVFESAPQIASVNGGACAIDFSVNASWIVFLAASAAVAITLINIPIGQPARVITIQPSSGAGTITWSSPTLRWSSGTVGQATGTASIIDVFVFYSPIPGTVLAGAAMPGC